MIAVIDRGPRQAFAIGFVLADGDLRRACCINGDVAGKSRTKMSNLRSRNTDDCRRRELCSICITDYNEQMVQ